MRFRRIPTWARWVADRWAWLTAQDWWRYQTVLAAAGLMLSLTALLGAGSSYIDEVDDSANNANLRRTVDRQQYEQECRFEIATRVTQIADTQLDKMTDLLGAVALRDRQAITTIIDDLEQLKVDKAEANLDRSDAVAICDRRARELAGG